MSDPRYEEFVRRLPLHDFVFHGAVPDGFIGGRHLVAGSGITLTPTAGEVTVSAVPVPVAEEKEAVFVQTARVNVNNTTTETTLFGAGQGSLTLPAGWWSLGRGLRITMQGFWSRASTAGNACPTFRVKVGGTTIATSVPIAVAGTVSGGAVALDILLAATAMTGTDPDLRGTGSVLLGLDGVSFANMNCRMSNAADVFKDQSGTMALDVTAQWPEANAGHLLQISNATVVAFAA